jgi:acyl-CoA synthetase (AMP-forming)/AMP-acid ligase II
MSDPMISAAKLPPEQEAIKAKSFRSTEPFAEFTEAGTEQSIPSLFDEIVRWYPDRPAFKTEDHTLTYAELDALANHAGRAIMARQESGSEPVALLFDKDVSLIASMIGAFKAGKICVVLDPSDPKSRIAAIFRDSQAGLVITQSQTSKLDETELRRILAELGVRMRSRSKAECPTAGCEELDKIFEMPTFSHIGAAV